MRVWFHFSEDFHCVTGDFEFISDLCSAIHEKLGKASPSAVCLQLAVEGTTLCPSDECIDSLPNTVTLHPKKDVKATPLELVFKSPTRVGSHRPSRRTTPNNHSRPSSGGRARPRYQNPVPLESETNDEFGNTSCDEATIVAACKNANRNLRRFDRNPALRGKDYFDHHMERIADQLHAVHDQKYTTGAGGDERPPTSPKASAEWVVMLCPPAPHDLQTRCIPCPSGKPARCLDVIRHIQRQVSDFLINEAFYYDEGFKDYVALNDASTKAMSGLLFVLCKPHRALSLQHHAVPEAPRPDNLRHTVMMSEYFNRMTGLLRGMENDEGGFRHSVLEEEQKTRVSMGMQEHSMHSSTQEFARLTQKTATQRATTPESRRPWYERVSPAGSPSKGDSSARRPTPPTSSAAKASPKKDAKKPILTPRVQDPIRTPAVPPKMSPCDPALATGIVSDSAPQAQSSSRPTSAASAPAPSVGKRLANLPGSTEHKQNHSTDQWGLPSSASAAGQWGGPELSGSFTTAPAGGNSRPSTPVVRAEDPQWGIPEGKKVIDAPSVIKSDLLSLDARQKHDADQWGAPTPVKTSSPTIPPQGQFPPIAPRGSAAVSTSTDGVVRAQDPQWGMDNSKKPVGVEQPSAINSGLSLPVRQHEGDQWGAPSPALAANGPQWGVCANPTNAADGVVQSNPVHVGGFVRQGNMINNGVKVEPETDLLNVRRFWFDSSFVAANAKASLGLDFFHLALLQHPNLARGLMAGWDLVAAAMEYNTILDLIVRGALTIPALKAKIATAKIAGILTPAHPVSERHHHYFITTTISALLAAIPVEKKAEFNDEFSAAWTRTLTAVVDNFVQCVGPQTAHTFQTETTLTAQLLSLEAPPLTSEPAAAAPQSQMLVAAGDRAGTPPQQTIAPIPDMVLASMEKPMLSAVGAVPETTKQTNVGQLADVAPEVRAGGATTPTQQTITPIPDMVLASMEKPTMSAVGAVPQTTIQTNVGELADVAPEVRAGGATTPTQQTIAPIPDMVLASMEKPMLSAVGAVPETTKQTNVGELADRPSSSSSTAVAGAPRATGYTAPSFMPVAGMRVRKSEYKTRLAAFFSQYCPEMTSVVDETLDRVKGSEDALFARLTGKYGPEPLTVIDDSVFDKKVITNSIPAVPDVDVPPAAVSTSVAVATPVVSVPVVASAAPVPSGTVTTVEEEPELGKVKRTYSDFEV